MNCQRLNFGMSVEGQHMLSGVASLGAGIPPLDNTEVTPRMTRMRKGS